MTDPIVLADKLTKRYGRARGVEELTFAVGPGEVFGYLGSNGAGKTTTIRLLVDLIRPSAGRVRVFGLDPHADGAAIRRRVGYLPGDLRLYERLTGREQLRYFASLRGLRGLGDGELLAERFGLDLDRRISTLSLGNRQKVGLVQAFVHRPDLLVLEEPTSGLDRALAIGAATAGAVAAYLVNGLAGLVPALHVPQKLSPFYHYAAGDPLRQGLALDHSLVLVAIVVAAATVGVVAFERRDLASS